MLNIKKIREQKNISRYRLSKLTGIEQSTLRTIETRSDNPGFLTIKKICEALDTNLYEVKELNNQQKLKR